MILDAFFGAASTGANEQQFDSLYDTVEGLGNDELYHEPSKTGRRICELNHFYFVVFGSEICQEGPSVCQFIVFGDK